MAQFVIRHRLGGIGGHRSANLVEYTPSDSYTAGGDNFSPSDVGLSRVDAVFVAGVSGGYSAGVVNESSIVLYQVDEVDDPAPAGPLVEVGDGDYSDEMFVLMVVGLP